MKRFSYKVKDKDGNTLSGIIESPTDTQAVRTLQAKGMFVISIVEKKSYNLTSLLKGINSVSESDVAVFTRLLSTMLATGLPLTDALSNLAIQFQNGYFREVIQSVLRDVQSGSAMSEAMSKFPKVFGNLYINLIKAGEASGKVSETLSRLAETLESQLDFRSKIKGAMIYPSVILLVTIAISIFMLTTILPKIAEVYKNYGGDLPLPTKILMGISTSFSSYWWMWIVGISIIVFSIRTVRKNPAGDYLVNNFLLKLPVFGPLSENVAYTLFCRTLAALISSGVDILEAIKIVSLVMSNNYIRAGLVTAGTAVEKGLPFSLALRRNGNFPQMMVQLCAIGEETGTLDQSLNRLASFYQEAAERRVKTLTTSLEPILLLIMGVTVGGLAIAVLLPMFNLVNVIK